MAWLGTWSKRKAIKYGTTKPISNLTDFQLLLNISTDSDLGSELGATPKLAFTAADGTTAIAHGRISWSYGGGNVTASIRFKFSPLSSASTGDIMGYVYYDSTQTDTQNKSGVFTSEYKAYLTCDDNPTGSANDILDWTSNSNHGSSQGSMASTVTGQVGNALTFDATNDYVSMPTDFIGDWVTGTPDMYLSVWVKTSTYGGIFGQQESSGNPYSASPSGWVPALYIDTNGKAATSLFWHNSVGLTTSTTTVSNGSWHYITCVFSGGVETIYIDGTSEASRSSLSQATYSGNYYYFLGALYWNYWTNTSGSVGALNGQLDDFKFALGSGAAKSANWITYAYANENGNSNTITLGTQETNSTTYNETATGGMLSNGSAIVTLFPTDWLYYKVLTVDKTYVGSDLTDFSLLVKLTSDSDLSSHALSNGADIRFSDDSSTPTSYPYGIISYSSGTLFARVKVPTIFTSTNTKIRIWYGNSIAINAQNKTTAINGSTVGYWPLEEDPSGGAGAVKDWSSNANNGTSSGSMTTGDLVVAQVKNGLDFDGSDDMIDCGNAATVKVNTGTLTALINTTSPGGSYRSIASKSEAYGMFLDSSILVLYDWGASTPRSTGVNLANSTWHHVCETFDSGVTNGTKIYIDGVLSLTTTITVLSQSNYGLGIGSSPNAVSQSFAGKIDEVKLDNTIRNADWVAFDYENQLNNRVSAGAEQSGSGSTYNETATGGVLANSSATYLSLFNMAATGSVLANSSATYLSLFNMAATGSVLANGLNTNSAIFNQTALNGIVIGGNATVLPLPPNGIRPIRSFVA